MPFSQKGEEGRYVTELEAAKAVRSGNVYFGNRICPFAHMAWWTSKEVGFESMMDYIHVELGDNKPAWYAGINPLGTVPCLYVDGHRICESKIIVEYMNEKMKGTLLPEDPIKRADARFLIAMWGDKVFAKLYTVLRTTDPCDRQCAWEQLLEVLSFFDHAYEESKSKDGPYFMGNDLSMVEIVIMPFIARFATLLPHYHGLNFFKDRHIPTLERAYREVLKRPAFAATKLDAELCIQFYNAYVHGSKAIVKKKDCTCKWRTPGYVLAGAAAGFVACKLFCKRS
ncbi:hypothetical protein PTSG_06311 [Salpingoeca rosetta]|uniref:Glutathione S-transferase n=1 Tax=Salpingoeca rosetta (strain ATCC 50818 / BSB-021) TaxID=946362 RepID=F2UCJ5_SALR5|nr:uncharacterized protein PTSG_06311 [Salpingoeca rosetta]EGD74302.1 hypothetical protein PTSG_06311 [Salpingoeca rosetta]|eukprot:XP_004993202.1 hypothetical protein PTSG_06311 [Salpingoeca rosetta]